MKEAETVLITGGNRGIGLECTRLFVEKGYHVIVVARNFSDFPYREHPQVRMLPFDVSRVEEIPALVKEIGYVDVLLNNAGIMYSLPYDAYPEDKKENLMNVNLYAPVAFITHMAPLMMERGKGRIVTVASIAGQVGHPDIWYGISKAGVINVTKSFAKILAPKGVIINAVAPGPTETDMMAVIPESRKKAVMSSVYSGRFARPDEVAGAMYWLAAEAPEYINGICLDINNGAFPR